jgi:copper(I)-binding protein
MVTGVRVLRAIAWWLLCAPVLGASQEVTVRDAWIREAPPSATVLAGYATLANVGDAQQRIVGASSPAFGAVELHTMSHDGGVMRMRPLESITVPARGEASLSPGADHLMLMRPSQPIRAGDRIDVTIELDDGTHIVGRFEVRPLD